MFEKGSFKIKKGDLKSCKYDKRFIENSLLSRVSNIEKIDYCVESGLISTTIKSIDTINNLEFNYYIISNNQNLKHYKNKIRSLEYEQSMPIMKAPYTNYHFVVDDYLILLSHYGLKDHYFKYDIKKYMELIKEKLKKQ